MLVAVIAILIGLVVLLWSADAFVEGAAALAGHLKLPPLFIGFVIMGFGTSAPELLVSAISALEGKANLALGNAYGSNIANIALVLGITVLVSPVVMARLVLRKELIILVLITLLAGWQAFDGAISRLDAGILLLTFTLIMLFTFYKVFKNRDSAESVEIPSLGLTKAWVWLILGLVLLLASSRLLVWGAVELATLLGLSELIIGLTIVAVGTSLPELAASITAVRKGENSLVIGNLLGSNFFNTLAVVGLAGVIQPLSFGPEVLWRDLPVMLCLTLSLYIFALLSRQNPSEIDRNAGVVLLAGYGAYLYWLLLF